MQTETIGLSLIIAATIALGCSSTGAPITDITGTWGGKDAGLIATDTSAHVHIGCTLGDTKGRIVPDVDGRFSISGTYDVDAYPIERGIIHPAIFFGQIVGRTMTLTVTLTDTTRVLGPVTLVLGKEPQMGPCPICRHPGEKSAFWSRRISQRFATSSISSRN
ncbi:MAG: hypothetical protein ACRD3J_19865 [Thermoanaerobaculia bacterium]